jgi:hypothetical protein
METGVHKYTTWLVELLDNLGLDDGKQTRAKILVAAAHKYEIDSSR